MNTVIKINGLDVEFSGKVPTKPGVYWWSDGEGQMLETTHVIINENGNASAKDCVDLMWRDCVEWPGIWSTSPLVPAVEVEKAWTDGAEYGDLSRLAYERGGDFDPIQTAYAKSRAKRVTEGGE